MSRSKGNLSNIEWEINILEWEISIVEASFDLKPVTRKLFHKRVFENILQVFARLKSYIISPCKAIWQHEAEDPRRVFSCYKSGNRTCPGFLLLFEWHIVRFLSKT